MKISAQYLCQGKAEEGGDAVASLTDDNAAMTQRVGLSSPKFPQGSTSSRTGDSSLI